MINKTKRTAMTVASAVMAVIALAVPVSTAVLHTRSGLQAQRESTAEPSGEEPPIRYGEGGELFIFDDIGFDRHLLVIGDEKAQQIEQTPSGDIPFLGESSPRTQETDIQDSPVTTLNSNHDEFAETLIELPTPDERRNDLLELRLEAERLEAERLEAERKRALRKSAGKEKTKIQPAMESGEVQENGTFLIKIKNPDTNYVGRPLKVKDRHILEGLVMGEFGNDYIGAVLVAQCIRDSMVKSGTNSAAVIKRTYGYTAPVRRKVTQDVKKAVAFVFDEGGSGVQHPIYFFYASNLVRGRWHETQKFVVQRKAVRFFSSPNG